MPILTPPSRPLQGMIYNVDVGRDGVDAAGAVIRAMRNHGVDVAWLQETARLVGDPNALGILRQHGLQVACHPDGGRMARSTAIVTRRHVDLRGPSLHQMHERGWERGGNRRGLHPPREWTSARVEHILRAPSVHMPPTPWAPRKPRRGESWDECMATLDGMVTSWSRHSGLWLLPGDWNVTPRYPRWWGRIERFADRHDATIHRAGGGVDFVLAGPDLRITDMRRIWRRYGSDHRPRVFSIHDDR